MHPCCSSSGSQQPRRCVPGVRQLPTGCLSDYFRQNAAHQLAAPKPPRYVYGDARRSAEVTTRRAICSAEPMARAGCGIGFGSRRGTGRPAARRDGLRRPREELEPAAGPRTGPRRRPRSGARRRTPGTSPRPTGSRDQRAPPERGLHTALMLVLRRDGRHLARRRLVLRRVRRARRRGHRLRPTGSCSRRPAHLGRRCTGLPSAPRSPTRRVAHLRDILCNVETFYRRCGWWPMTDWLQAFADRGLAHGNHSTERWARPLRRVPARGNGVPRIAPVGDHVVPKFAMFGVAESSSYPGRGPRPARRRAVRRGRPGREGRRSPGPCSEARTGDCGGRRGPPTTAAIPGPLRVLPANAHPDPFGYTAGSLDLPIGTEHNGSETVTYGDVKGDVDPAMELVENLHALAPLLKDLDDRDREIVAMRFGQEMTQAQIGVHLGISASPRCTSPDS